MRALPAPGQAGRFLGVWEGAGSYHRARLAVASAILFASGAGLAWAAGGTGLLGALGGVSSFLAAAAAVAYLAGLLLPFSRGPVRLRLRAYALWVDRVVLRTLLRAARLVGDKTDPLLRAFVQANNAAVRAYYRVRKPDNVMVLLPHCVVWTRCPKKVVKDLSACRECDLCQMEEILGIADRAALPVGIAIRSVEAYTQAREMGPDLTIAVACDDRLVKGITRVPEIPAFGLPLHLPEEGCHDNLVDLPGLHAALGYFIGAERMAGRGRPRSAFGTAADPLPGGPLALSGRRLRLPVLEAPAAPRASASSGT